MKVAKLWFENERLYITDNEGQTYFQSLKFYPRLMLASDEERNDYELGAFGIHWEQIDEDVSYESFSYDDAEEVQPGIQKLFLSHPELNISAIARKMGIQQSLLASYINGTKKPSEERKKLILETIHQIGHELIQVELQ